jgi:hypothetical protein
MRAGLEAAIKASRDESEGYPKGSTVICAHCFVPLYILTQNINPGDKASRSTQAYRPVCVQDIRTLRRNVPSVTAALKSWTVQDEIAHEARVVELKNGSPAQCPSCLKSFVQVFAPDANEVIDHAYTWRLVTIPPLTGPYPVRSAHVSLG